MNCLSPSILAADFSILGEQIQILDREGAEYIHIDVMDGHFVPTISFGVPIIKSIRKYTDKKFDVHLMVEEPLCYIQEFVDAGADLITVHVEACRHLDLVLTEIRRCGAKVGVAVNPATPITVLEHILEKVDMVLLMAVNPGAGGQKYIPYCTEKIRKLREWMNEKGLQIDIEVDGGVTTKNLQEVIEAGANIIVAGSAIFGGNIQVNVQEFRKIMKENETR